MSEDGKGIQNDPYRRFVKDVFRNLDIGEIGMWGGLTIGHSIPITPVYFAPKGCRFLMYTIFRHYRVET